MLKLHEVDNESVKSLNAYLKEIKIANDIEILYVNDIILFFMNDNMFLTLLNIFNLHKIEYNDTYLKKIVIPTIKNINYNNEKRFNESRELYSIK